MVFLELVIMTYFCSIKFVPQINQDGSQPSFLLLLSDKRLLRSLFQGELELPFLALLLVILSHYEVMRFRNTKEGAIISLLIAVYLTYQHFSRTSLQKSLDQGSIVATIAVVCITIASLLFLI
ncbi:hypothetical protein AHAS_Ahas05G0110600 [Arachis hypogaea]